MSRGVRQTAVPAPAVERRRHALVAADGVDLALHRWTAPGVRATLLYLHGIQSHAGWLHRTGPELVRRGVELFVPDRRGSGASGGARGHAPSAEVLIDDHDRAVAAVRRYRTGTRTTALGQSFGGSLLAALLARRAPQLSAVLLCAPALGQQRARAAARPGHLDRLRGLRGTARSPLGLSDTDYTDDAADLARIAADPLAVREVTDAMRATMVQLEDAYLASDRLFDGPVAVALPRRDPIIDLDAARRVLRARAPQAVETTFATDRHYLEFSAARVDYWDWLARAVLRAEDGDRPCG